MADAVTEQLNSLFAPPPANELPPDVLGELRSILRLHSISPQELHYKWDSYCFKMGSEETLLNLSTVRAFKTDVQESLEKEIRSKAHLRSTEKRGGHGVTSRNVSNEDFFNMLDGVAPTTPQSGGTHIGEKSTAKRKAAFETPGVKKVIRSPATPLQETSDLPKTPIEPGLSGGQAVSFADRPNAGQIMETLNEQLTKPEPPLAPPPEARIKLTANTDLKKFSYRPMAMHLSEASEILDDRIDEFLALVQSHHSLPDDAFANPATQNTSEIVAVGRIASDSLDAKPNVASLVLESSRRTGAGIRVPLKVEDLSSFQFFPGQIVALKGVNASGAYFSVREVLDLPLLPNAASPPATLDLCAERLRGGPDAMEEDNAQPLNVLIGAGPYSADDNLDFQPLHTLCDKASTTYADVLILTGPFLDVEHPALASGDFDFPAGLTVDADTATLTTVFRGLISAPLRRLAEAVPSITIILLPSVRDAICKHVSWPQEPFPRNELGLPKQARIVSNPITLSLNELIFGISALDVMSELRVEEVLGSRPKTTNILARLPRHLIEQRHFFPLFPSVGRRRLLKPGIEGELATGAVLDTSYLKLGEWLNVRPDVLITPSALPPFAKVVESVLVINPGMSSKRRAPGTFAQMTIHPATVTDEERVEGKMVGHKIYERGRVDICRI
ncbi:MAG: DNA-directed DNA polymerase alpha subunit pol12 [Sclerophora amabilis]|nr:MAG: DNA-directed DNA polymerase alpha subunit pol12 [Sclerophora amabilis]